MNEHLRSPRGVAKILLEKPKELTYESLQSINYNFRKLATKAKDYLKNCRIKDLEEINQKEKFIAIFDRANSENSNSESSKFLIIEGFYTRNISDGSNFNSKTLHYISSDSENTLYLNSHECFSYKKEELWAFKKLKVEE